MVLGRRGSRRAGDCRTRHPHTPVGDRDRRRSEREVEPMGPELADLVDVDQVPEPLRRRGVYIEAGELVSA